MRVLLLTLVCIGLLQASEPVKYPDWPTTPVVTPPAVKPVATDPATLPSGVLYVVQGDGTEQLLPSPANVVKVQEFAGPIGIYGKFIDGAGTELRTYGAKQIWVVERVLAGQVELLKVPKGKVERRMLDTDVPPKPDAPAPAKSLRVIFVVESGDKLSVQQQGVIYGAKMEAWALKNCTGGKDGFKKRDPDNLNITGTEMKAIWEKARPSIARTPCVIVEKNNHIEVIDVADTPEAMIQVFDEYLSGKRGK